MSLLPSSININEETVFVVGNGPSLRRENLEILSEHPWVGMNAAYRHWQREGNFPTYYACLDLIVGLSHGEAIADLVMRADSLGIKAFLLRDNLISQYSALSKSSRVVNFDIKFAHLPSRTFELVTTGSHSALWMAALGYKQILLLGIDGSYEEKILGAEAANPNDNSLVIQEDATNSNYYFDDYQQVGDQYTIPNPVPEVHLGAWRRVKQYLDHESEGDIKVYNCSTKSLIDISPFIKLADLRPGPAPVTSIEDTFAQCGLTEQREVIQSGLVDIAILVNILSPLRIGRIVANPETEFSQRLKKKGWVLSRSSEDLRTAIIVGNSEVGFEDMQNAGGVILATSTQKEAVNVLETLFAHHDTVLLLSYFDGKTKLSRYPCHIADEPMYAIAFKDKRFWREDLATAMNIAAKKSPEPQKLKRLWLRRIFSLRAVIHQNFNI